MERGLEFGEPGDSRWNENDWGNKPLSRTSLADPCWLYRMTSHVENEQLQDGQMTASDDGWGGKQRIMDGKQMQAKNSEKSFVRIPPRESILPFWKLPKTISSRIVISRHYWNAFRHTCARPLTYGSSAIRAFQLRGIYLYATASPILQSPQTRYSSLKASSSLLVSTYTISREGYIRQIYSSSLGSP